MIFVEGCRNDVARVEVMYHCGSMLLAEKTRFGPYEIISLLGAGGMGEVYQAFDTRLDPTVAIKICTGRRVWDGAGGVGKTSCLRMARSILSKNDSVPRSLSSQGRAHFRRAYTAACSANV